MILGFRMKVDDPTTGQISEFALRGPWPARMSVVPGDLILGMPEGPESQYLIEIDCFIHDDGPTRKPCSSCGSFEFGNGDKFRILVLQEDFWEGGGFLTVTATDSSGDSAQIVLDVAVGGRS